MPANPLHFLTILPLYYRRSELFDPLALFISSILVDFEMVIQLLLGESMHHGLWHSYLFVITIFPVALAVLIFIIESSKWEKCCNYIMFLGNNMPHQKYSILNIYISCLVGGISHIFLDMWTHEISPYIMYPQVGVNSFWLGDFHTYVLFVVVSVSIYSLNLWRIQQKQLSSLKIK